MTRSSLLGPITLTKTFDWVHNTTMLNISRNALCFLDQWVQDPSRKPLVIRGARQVGKTWLVREFAALHHLDLIEINFEFEPAKKDCFIENDPAKIWLHLELICGRRMIPEQSVLFLDEIQAFPEILAKLRWFKEKMPQLIVIVTGSLLEFILDEHAFSMPVGRISYLHLEPLSFDEFLGAENPVLQAFLRAYSWETIPLDIHQKCLDYLRTYTLVGGLPAAVSTWITTRSWIAVNQVHHDILITYRDDFARYKGRLDMTLFDTVFACIPKYVGSKIVYRQVSPDHQAASIKKVMQLIATARVIHMIHATHANGIPLGAEIREKFNKIICLDVGLMNASLGISFAHLKNSADIDFINQGAIAEQLVGQLLRTIEPFYIEPSLYYWQRTEPASNAEVDYVIQHEGAVLPIEVKAGTKGSMQSLHLFMGLKKLLTAVRLNTDRPITIPVCTKTALGDLAEYKLISLPIYLIGEIHRLIE